MDGDAWLSFELFCPRICVGFFFFFQHQNPKGCFVLEGTPYGVLFKSNPSLEEKNYFVWEIPLPASLENHVY